MRKINNSVPEQLAHLGRLQGVLGLDGQRDDYTTKLGAAHRCLQQAARDVEDWEARLSQPLTAKLVEAINTSKCSDRQIATLQVQFSSRAVHNQPYVSCSAAVFSSCRPACTLSH